MQALDNIAMNRAYFHMQIVAMRYNCTCNNTTSGFSAPSIIRKSITSIVQNKRHIHWALGKLSMNLAIMVRQLMAKYTDSFPNTQ